MVDVIEISQLCKYNCGNLRDGRATYGRSCRECWNKRQQELRADHPESHRAHSQRWREANRERHRAYSRKYGAEHPEQVREAHAQYYAANAEELCAKACQWAKDNPGKISARSARRRALELNAAGFFTADDWNRIVESQNGKCLDCGQLKKLTVGHAMPLSKGGSNWPSNIIAQCSSCNSRQYTSIHPSVMQKVAA